MTQVQKFLRDGGTIEQLQDKYKLDATRHRKYNNLVLLKYNMIESPMAEPIVQECRGIILDETDDWRVVSRPFDKFFNLGEGHAKPIDWATARVMEKLDGSLMTMYVYDGGWHVASSGTPDAGGQVSDFGLTFEDLFWNTLSSMHGAKPSREVLVRHCLPEIDCNKCFFFELTSPYNKIVVKHSEATVTLLGARDLKTQKELTLEEAGEFFPGLPVVKCFPLNSFDACVDTFATMSPLSQEGYVVSDANFHRVKVKHPGYVSLHHMRDGLGSTRALVNVVRNGEIDEVVVSFPEYEKILLEAKGKLECLIAELEGQYNMIAHIEVQKDFALLATKSRYPAALFSLRGKKTPSVKAYLRDIHIDSVMKLLGYKTNGT